MPPPQFGVFLVPDAEDAERTIQRAITAEDLGLDLIGVQDHPYQRRFLDTFSLLAYIAGRTTNLRLVPDVANLPLRPPAVLAKAAATIDVLSNGRFELGLGAGAFWDAIEAMGGPRRSPGGAVDALQEAIEIIRRAWSDEPAVTFEGDHYRVKGFKPGPQPAHPISLWIGAYGPRMLRLTGRLGDGWLPSAGYLDLAEAAERHRAIDEAAKRAGRDPAEIRRAINAGVSGPPEDWPGQLERFAEHRFDTVLCSVPDQDPLGFVARLGEVAARLRARSGPS
jgi:alkanesulfonate monooxygenase SsuD/methylene tetrahydromethanopterin reductase-like flavin-dependent oxidoreductase (luciferase family)